MRYFILILYYSMIMWPFIFHMMPQAHAQQYNQIGLGVGIQQFAGRDLAFSPLTYSGQRSVLMGGYDTQVGTIATALSLGIAKGVVKSSGGNLMDTWTVNLMSHLFRHVLCDSNQKFMLGLSMQNEINSRLHHSFSNFNNRTDYVTSIGPSIMYLYPFLWEKGKIHWKTTAHMQGLGFIFGSDYISTVPRLFGLTGSDGAIPDYLSNVFLVGKDWSLGYLSELRFEYSSGTSMAVQHQFDFQQVSFVQEVTRVRNSFALTISVPL